MGKLGDFKTLAGPEEIGNSGASGSQIRDAPEPGLVTSAKRQAILNAMLEVVGAEGYEQTSVRHVLAHSGVYRQAFYDNFADKEDCYLQAYDAGVERVEAQLVEAAAAERAWRGELRAGLRALLDFLAAEPDVGRALIVEVHAAGPQALARRVATMQRLTAFLDQARDQVSGGGSPPAIAGEGIAAGIHAIVHSRLAAHDDDGFPGLLPEFMYFAVLPYFGASVASTEMQAAKA